MAEPGEPDVPQVDVVDQIIVGFNPKIGLIGMEAALNRLKALPATVLNNFVAAPEDKKAFFAIAVIRYDGEKTFAELQEELTKDEHIAWVERNAPIAPLAVYQDPLFVQQWALVKLQATGPWTVAPTAAMTIVAIVDSGLRRWDGTVHADLGAVEQLVDCQPQPAGTFPGLFLDGIDNDGHGTLLAGTIAAVPDNVGIASPIPTTWNISLMPVKFFDAGEPPTASNAAIAIVWAAFHFYNPGQNANPVKVINASWRVAPGDDGLQVLAAAIVFAAALGCLVVFAAGNEGTDNEIYPTYPASFGGQDPFQGNVLSVLATDRYDAKAFFSNYGKHTVDIGAPGQHILSTGRYLVDPPRYAEYAGTSPAAAYASAGAALVFALNPGWTPHDVVEHLVASADTIEGLKLACIDGKRLNLGRAIYGPLNIDAPAAGDTLRVGAFTNIKWRNVYKNPSFRRVRIEFSNDDGANYGVLAASVNNNGLLPWRPVAGNVTAMGRIRITPTHGNFPVVSKRFRVVV
jgi:subtilisin family serine protease